MKTDGTYRGLLTIIVLGIVLAVALLYGLYQIRALFSPILAGLVTAYLLYPLVRGGRRLGIPRWVTTLAILVVFAGALTWIALAVLPAVRGELGAMRSEQAQSNTLRALGQIIDRLRDWGLIQHSWENKQIIGFISHWLAARSAELLGTFGTVAIRGGQFMMIYVIVLVFALYDGHNIYRGAVSMIPNRLFEPGLFVLDKTEKVFGDYLRGVVVESTILAVVAFVLLSAVCAVTKLTIVLALAIALLIAVTNVVRIIGPIVGGIIGVLMVLVTRGDLGAVLGVAVVVVAVQLLDNAVVLPMVMRETLQIHPLVSVLAITVGGMLAGPWGMVLAIPALAGIRTLYQVVAVELRKFILTSRSP